MRKNISILLVTIKRLKYGFTLLNCSASLNYSIKHVNEVTMKKISVMTACALMLGINNVYAAGYQLNEYSTTGLGRSFAGLGVVGDDYSAMGFNPAGMTLVKDSGFQLGMAATEIASKAKGEHGTDKMDYFVPLPSAMGQYNVNNKFFIGAGVYVPYGLSTKYKHDSHVATQSEGGVRKSVLKVIDSNLSLAYRFDNGLSIGGSAILRWIGGQLTSNINRQVAPGHYATIGYNDYRVNGWSNSWHLGAVYEFDKDTRLGLSYRFKSTQKPRGKQYVYLTDMGVAGLNGMAGMEIFDKFNRYNTMSDPELPASWILSGFHKWNDKWASSFTVKYAQWHRFYTFPAKSTFPGNGNYDVDYKWKDAWTFAVGQEYYMNDNWTLRAGTAWDQTPTPNNAHRTNRIPDTDRIWLSAGASYKTGNHQFDFGYAHLFMMHGRTRNDLATMPQHKDAQVEYHNHSNMFAVQYQYHF